MITNAFENSGLIEIMLLLFILLGFAVCMFILRSILLNVRREEKFEECSFDNTLFVHPEK